VNGGRDPVGLYGSSGSRTMIRVEELSRRFGDVTALDRVSF